MLNPKTVLVISPHPDDAELGAGAFISKLTESGVKVHEFLVSEAPERINEAADGATVLGIDRVFRMKLKIRKVPKAREALLDTLVHLRNKIKPDLVIQPSLTDIHQDHQVVAEECVRAFKNTSVIGYEAAWNNFNFEAQLFVSITEQQLGKKIKAVRKHISQNGKSYSDEEFIKSLARVRGAQAGVCLAEMFSVIRMVA